MDRDQIVSESIGKEALLQSIFRSAPIGIGLVVNRTFQWTNDRLSEMCGYTADELKGQTARMLYISDEEFEWVGREKYKQIKEKGTGSVDTQFKRKDDTIIDVHLSSTPINPDDLSEGVTFTALDITYRTQAEKKLKLNEERLNLAIEGSDLGMWDWNIATNDAYFSPRYFTMLGYGPDELPHSLDTWTKLLHPDDLELVKGKIASSFASKPADYIWVLGRGKVVEYSKDGTPLRAAGTHLDITGHKIAEKKLKDSESLFRELFNNMSTGVAIYNAVENGKDFIFKDLNKAGLLSSQLKYHEVVGRSLLDLFPGVKEMGLFDVFQRVWETGTPEHYPSTFYQDNRVAMWVENYVCKLPSGELVAIYDDITERKQAEEEIIRNKEQWERTFNSFSDIVTLQDIDMRIMKINKAGCDTVEENCENIIGSHCYELFHGTNEPCPECPLLETKKTFKPYTKEMTHEKMGKTFLVSAAPVMNELGELTHIAHVAKDVTEMKKIEARLFLNEKMATIAGLAAGVAHEINTPLSAILQSQQMIEMRLSPDTPRNQECATECG
ncbi:MAG: PAS domain S-box protein, partial [Deltaproteobacteria bacterium]|nr:PAS domain S-box protein [Deltaproteobacteria bacterium]